MAERQAIPTAHAGSRVLARAARLAPEPPIGNTLSDLAADLSVAGVSQRRGLTPATVLGIRSYYDQIEHVTRVCDGTACHFAGGDAVRERLASMGPAGSVRCLGHCYRAPAFRSGDKIYTCPPSESVEGWLDEWGEGPSPMVDLHPVPRTCLADEPLLLRRLLPGVARDAWGAYDLPDGDSVLRAIESAGVSGGEGATLPAAARWRTARDTDAPQRWVVANGDEGDPGSYVDRLLLEEDPHAVLAGMLACARAIGASRGIVYVRAEYPVAIRSLRAAIAAAHQRGVLGRAFDVEVFVGAGAYVCGDENALLRCIEGLRGEPAPVPAFPSGTGLHGQPTVVHDVESFAGIAWSARSACAPDTTLVCLSGAVRRPGVAEIPLGMPLAEVLERAGGGEPDGRRWGMALVGGPLGRLLPAARFDTPLSDEALPGMGHAGVVVLDDTVTPRALAEHLFAFAAAESCGACAPCRAGAPRLAAMRDRAALERLLLTLETGSLCAFGRRLPRPVRDLLEHFGAEVLR